MAGEGWRETEKGGSAMRSPVEGTGGTEDRGLGQWLNSDGDCSGPTSYSLRRHLFRFKPVERVGGPRSQRCRHSYSVLARETPVPATMDLGRGDSWTGSRAVHRSLPPTKGGESTCGDTRGEPVGHPNKRDG